MSPKTDSEGLDTVLKAVMEKNLLTDECPCIDIFDLDYFRSRMAAVKEAFPEPFFLHTLAMKANSMRGVILTAKEQGFGAEGASISEAMHAIALGFPAEKVIFDSPCKTRFDMKLALKHGIYMNLDNENEVAMMDELLKLDEFKNTKSKIGLRINPVVGGGSIAIMSTATAQSKFGLPVTVETKAKVINLYKENPWLTGIHIHIGSQGVALDLFVRGAKLMMDIVKEIECSCGRDLITIDLGGGISTSYTDNKEPQGYEYATYRQQLEEVAPDLFTGKYNLITEFGRSLTLKSGKTLSRLDWVKQWIPDVKPILLQHVGSNQFIRECYNPKQWRHRMTVCSPEGVLKDEEPERVVYDIGGPLCFQGDYLARDVELPKVSPGDFLVIHDTGGYCYGLYSHYNSILPGAVYAYERNPDDDQSITFKCFKERPSIEENLSFWGLAEPRIVN